MNIKSILIVTCQILFSTQKILEYPTMPQILQNRRLLPGNDEIISLGKDVNEIINSKRYLSNFFLPIK